MGKIALVYLEDREAWPLILHKYKEMEPNDRKVETAMEEKDKAVIFTNLIVYCLFFV